MVTETYLPSTPSSHMQTDPEDTDPHSLHLPAPNVSTSPKASTSIPPVLSLKRMYCVCTVHVPSMNAWILLGVGGACGAYISYLEHPR